MRPENIVVPPPPYCETCQDCSNACHKEYPLLTREEALRRMMNSVKFRPETETVPLRLSLGRVTAANIYAPYGLPVSNTAMKDGVAVKSSELAGGCLPDTAQWRHGTHYLSASMGDALPEGYDTLILAEKIRFTDDGRLEILEMPILRQNVSAPGSRIAQGELIVPARLTLAPAHLGILASAGITEVEVLKKPTVAILPTGNELVALGVKPNTGQTIESNSVFLEASLRQWGAEALVYPIIADNPEELTRAIAYALTRSDIVLVNGGTGRGWEHYNDYTAKVLAELGEILVHGLLMGPGKPTLIGVAEQKPVLGIPGPFHAALPIADIFVRPLIAEFLGQTPTSRPKVKAVLAENFKSAAGTESFRRVNIIWEDGVYRVQALDRLGDTVDNMVKAQGVLHIPQDSAGYEQGMEVEIELLYPEEIVKAGLLLF